VKPSTNGECRHVRADNSVIMNGLTNAMKFCSGGDILISLRTSPHLNACILTIQDHGIGIDAQVLPRLMQPFTKIDTDSPGAGLGLYITKAIVEEMGGALTLHSTKGEGTTFTATIPVRLLRPDPPAALVIHTDLRPAKRPRTDCPERRVSVTTFPQNPQSQPTPIDDPLRPIKILVIDDNSICRKLLQMAFKRATVSITTLEAENGQIGVDMFTEFQPDIVFTDVSMPVMDGVTAAGRMREMLSGNPRDCRIYALTGLGSSDPRTQSLGVNGKAALDGWLVKGKDMLDSVYKILQEVGEDRQRRK
jgi:CheY-like chemotaxis protein/anti-sigma regulatory factor (Ser/Thr protein kinase)